MAILLLVGCRSRNEVEQSSDAVANVDALWQIIDEKYCYVEEKNIDWYAIGQDYREQARQLNARAISDSMSSVDYRIALFDLMASMLDSLRDGHVNLYTPFDVSRNSSWYEDYPANFNSQLQRPYLGDYRTAGGLYYNKIDNDSIGYIYYNSFSSSCSNSALAWILTQFKSCRGIVLDIRQNGGGDMTNADQLASIFFREDRTIGYWQHKTGPGHTDFSQPEPQRITANTSIRWRKPVIVLTNRRCYSAANYFTGAMKNADNCLVIGGKTGGGGGMPMSYELPIGWTVRFSSVRMMDLEMQSIEDGIDPDMEVTQMSNNQDDLIEKAIEIINKAYDKSK